MAEHKVSNAFIWKALERYCVMGIQFLLQLVLARILTPSDFGVVAILGIFIAFSNIIVQSGFATALVQKKEISRNEISAVFSFSLLIASGLYLILFIFAPYIASFFEIQQLSKLLRVLSISIFPFFFNSIQTSLLSRGLKFRSLFVCTLLALGISGAIAVYLAINGFGVWALVCQQIVYSVVICITLLCVVRFIPSFNFSFKTIKPLLDFGGKVLATSLINEFFSELRTIIIGRMYTPSSLGYFNRGRSFPDLGTKSIVNSLQSVLLPVFSRHQDELTVQKYIMRKSILLGTYFTWPLLGIICVCATPLVSLCLTEKWLPCVRYIYIFSVYFAAWPIENINLQVYYANGRSGTVLKLEFTRKLIDILALSISIWYGVEWIALSASLVSLVCLPLYMRPSLKLFEYGILSQTKDILPNLILTLASCITALAWIRLINNYLFLMILQVITILIIYISLSYYIKSESLQYSIEYCKLYFRK